MVLVSQQNDPHDELRLGMQSAFPDMSFVRVCNEEEAADHIGNAEILLAFSPSVSARLVDSAPGLQWIQLLGSGLDDVLAATYHRRDILITSGRGAQAEPVSEAIIGFMFALARDFPRLVQNQGQRRWERWAARLLKGSTVVVVGVGAIAETLAPKCVSLGMLVFGVSSSPRSVPGFEDILPLRDLERVARQADYLVILTPSTAATRNLIDGKVLAAMKRSGFFINAARGSVVDEPALVEALESRGIAGAALDVFAIEPLPDSSPLWSCPNTIISPHLGGLNEGYAQELLPILKENMRHFVAGELDLMRNVV